MSERYECVVCGEPWPEGSKSCPRVNTCSGYRWLNTRGQTPASPSSPESETIKP